MDDIAGIYHWPLSELEAMPIDRLIYWRERAVAWWNRHRAGKE
ncbi:MAG: GpE family phage tail protein [Sphingomonadales bacterium]|nr:GpE family phage tail protein [Sphingomonadales bacterium]